MQNIREAGCLAQSLAGCALLVFMSVGCMIVASFTLRAALPEALPPVEVKGDCPPAEVQAFLDDIEPRLEIVFEPLDRALQGDRPLEEAVADLDLAALRAAREQLAETPAPACAAPLVEAELALVDESMEIVASLHDCLDANGNNDLCVPRALFKVSTRLPRHAGRLSLGYQALAEEAGVELPEEIDFGEGEDGLKLQLDQGTDGFEIQVP